MSGRVPIGTAGSRAQGVAEGGMNIDLELYYGFWTDVVCWRTKRVVPSACMTSIYFEKCWRLQSVRSEVTNGFRHEMTSDMTRFLLVGTWARAIPNPHGIAPLFPTKFDVTAGSRPNWDRAADGTCRVQVQYIPHRQCRIIMEYKCRGGEKKSF